MNISELLTVRRVATIYSVHPGTVRGWIRNGTLLAVALPHKGEHKVYRVRRDRVERLINDEKQAS
jgi:predicted site-specific integrase-resolvase